MSLGRDHNQLVTNLQHHDERRLNRQHTHTLRGVTETLLSVNGGENRVLRVYLSRSRTCSFFIAVLMGARTRLVRQHPSRSDANRSKR